MRDNNIQLWLIEENDDSAEDLSQLLQDRMPAISVRSVPGFNQFLTQPVETEGARIIMLTCAYVGADVLAKVQQIFTTQTNTAIIVASDNYEPEYDEKLIAAGVSDCMFRTGATVEHLVRSIRFAAARVQKAQQSFDFDVRFHDLFELSPQPMWVYEIATLKFQHVNNAAIRHYGYSRKEFLQMTLLDIRLPYDIQSIQDAIQSSHNTQEIIYSGVFRHQKKSGDLIFVEIYSSFVSFNNKACKLVIAVDITNKKEAEKALEEMQLRYSTILKAAHEGIVEADITGAVVFVNDYFAGLIEYPRQQLIHKIASHIISAGSEAVAEQRLANLQKGISQQYEALLVSRSGKEINVLVQAMPLFKDDTFIGVISTVLDISTQKKTNEQLLNSEQKYRNAQKIGKMGNWELNLATQMLSWSDEIYEIFRIEKQSTLLPFKTFFERVHPADRKRLLKEQLLLLRGKKQKMDLTHRILMPDGNIEYVHELGEMLPDEVGQPSHFAGTVQNVTQRVENEVALRQNEARLKAIIDSQSSFVVRTDTGHGFTYYNQHFFDVFGFHYGKTSLIGEDALQCIKPYHREKLKKTVALCMKHVNEVQQVELDKMGVNNTTQTTLWDFVCLTNEKNEPVEIQSVGIDITEWKKTRKALIQSLKERNQILESIGDVFFAVDYNWHITYWNKEAEVVSGFSRRQMVGKSLKNNLVNAGYTELFEKLASFDPKERFKHFEYFSEKTKTWWDASLFASEAGLSVYFKNIHKRKQAEAEIINNERKLQVLFDTVAEIIFMVGIEEGNRFRLLAVNNAGLSGTNFSRNAVVGNWLEDLVTKEEYEIFEKHYQQAIKTKASVSWIAETVKDGSVKTGKVNLAPVLNDEGECIMLVGSVFDITEQLAYEEKLELYNTELRQLASHLHHVREEERLHMAREIHDELGQQLTGIKMTVSSVNRRLKGEEELTQKLTESISLIDQTISTVRKIAAELRPSVLDDLGLAEAIKWQSRDFSKRYGIAVECHTNLDEHKYTDEINVAVFRIYQESLTNILRHAEATEVTCLLEQIDYFLQLTVYDNGLGFDQELQKQKRSLGLIVMKERVKMLNGEFTIESEPGKGTSLIVKIPLS